MPRTIVLGWRNTTDHQYRYDTARAAVWLNAGTSYDLRRARDYAKRQGYKVFVFRTDEPKPLERARALVN